MTQLARIIRASRSFRGTCQADWISETTPDSGPRITRVAARIRDARDLGYEFEQLHDRNGTRVYRLVSEPDLTDLTPSEAKLDQGGVEGSAGEEKLSRELIAPSNTSPDAPLSLFDGIERGKGKHGFHDQEAA